MLTEGETKLSDDRAAVMVSDEQFIVTRGTKDDLAGIVFVLVRDSEGLGRRNFPYRNVQRAIRYIPAARDASRPLTVLLERCEAGNLADLLLKRRSMSPCLPFSHFESLVIAFQLLNGLEAQNSAPFQVSENFPHVHPGMIRLKQTEQGLLLKLGCGKSVTCTSCCVTVAQDTPAEEKGKSNLHPAAVSSLAAARIFSLGVVLLEVVTPPLSGDSVEDLRTRFAQSNTPKALSDLVLRMTSGDSNERPTAAEAKAALCRIDLSGGSISAIPLTPSQTGREHRVFLTSAFSLKTCSHSKSSVSRFQPFGAWLSFDSRRRLPEQPAQRNEREPRKGWLI